MGIYTSTRAIMGANSGKDYADMANGTNNHKTYTYTHLPYHSGNRNLLKEYSEILKKKGAE